MPTAYLGRGERRGDLVDEPEADAYAGPAAPSLPDLNKSRQPDKALSDPSFKQ